MQSRNLVYVAAPLTHANKRQREDILAVKRSINERKGVRTLQWHMEKHNMLPEHSPSAREVYRFDLNQIQRCDVFVPIYIDVGSDGRGIELVRAADFEKRIVGFKFGDVSISLMARGLIQRYENASLRTVGQLHEIPQKLSDIIS